MQSAACCINNPNWSATYGQGGASLAAGDCGGKCCGTDGTIRNCNVVCCNCDGGCSGRGGYFKDGRSSDYRRRRAQSSSSEEGGEVDEEELATMRARETFAHLDKDHDGVLSWTEAKHMMQNATVPFGR